MSDSALLTIAPDAAFLAGHFQDNPIVPGVVILERVAEQVLRSRARPARIGTVTAAKFLSPLRPGELLTIEWTAADAANTVRFHCRTGERRVAEGVMQVTEHP
jgi:3-hydroxymyristoyl/3-hydroxydecanoyl-(acyl carrier protein) dehydratase